MDRVDYMQHNLYCTYLLMMYFYPSSSKFANMNIDIYEIYLLYLCPPQNWAQYLDEDNPPSCYSQLSDHVLQSPPGLAQNIKPIVPYVGSKKYPPNLST